jgi:hypothetical protein
VSSERMQILNMVSDGKLAVEDAVQLLSVLTRLETEEPTPVEDGVEVATLEPEAVPMDEATSAIDGSAEPTEPPGQQPQPSSGRGIWTRFKRFVSSIG